MKQGSRFLVAMAVLLAVCWLVPIYLIAISALGPKEAATAWPKSLIPTAFSFDTMGFFLRYTGVWTAVWNSVVVALLTMLFAVLLGAPAGTPDVRRQVGYLPEDHQFPGYHTGYSLLDFSAAMYGVATNSL